MPSRRPDQPAIDYAASPTLTTIRELVGDAVVLRLVAAKGGTWVHLPRRLGPDSELVRLVGAEAAAALVARFGGGAALRIPTGRGHGHGRRLDHAEIVRLHEQDGWSAERIARAMGCTDRQIWNILGARRRRDPRQASLV
jgi:hypothetical protein